MFSRVVRVDRLSPGTSSLALWFRAPCRCAARGPTVAAVHVVHRGEGVRAGFEAAGDTYGQHGYDGNRSLGEQHGDGHLLRVLHAEGRGVPDRGFRRLESSLR